MKTTYTFNECYELLNVDPKTFRGWLKEANINPDDQVSRSDRRVRYLTKEQVDKLAVDHGRLLRTPAPDEPISPGAFKLLEDRVTNTEEGLSHQPDLLEKMDQRFIQQLAEISKSFTEQLAVQLAELEQFRTTIAPQLSDLADTQQAIVLQQQALLSTIEEIRQAQAQQMEQINETLAAHQHETQQIRKRIYEQLETTAHQLTAIEQSHNKLTAQNQEEHAVLRDAWEQTRGALDAQTMLQETNQFETTQRFTTVMNVGKQQYEQLETLSTQVAQLSQDVTQLSTKISELPAAAPTDTTLLTDFADQHYVSRDEAVKKWKAGFISGTKGTATGRSTRRSPATLDVQGKHDFWVQFHEAPGFRSCDDCPHAQETAK